MARRKKARTRTPLKHVVSPDEMQAHRGVARATPTRQDVERAYGVDRVVDRPDGTWECKINGAREHALYDEIDHRRATLEANICDGRIAAEVREECVTPDGTRFTAREDQVEMLADQRGARPVTNWGRPSRRFMNGRWYDLDMNRRAD